MVIPQDLIIAITFLIVCAMICLTVIYLVRQSRDDEHKDDLRRQIYELRSEVRDARSSSMDTNARIAIITTALAEKHHQKK